MPQSSVTVTRIELTPSTGTKQTCPSSILAGCPLTVTSTSAISLSGSLKPKPLTQISLRSQTVIARSSGQVTTGALLSVTSTAVPQELSLPHASMAVTEIELTPSIGTKQTWPSTMLAGCPLTVTSTSERSPSGSLKAKGPAQISLRSHTVRLLLSGQETTGSALRTIVISVVHETSRPQSSVAVSTIELTPSEGTKHTLPSLTAAGTPLTAAVTPPRLPFGSLYSNPATQISLRSQTVSDALSGHVTTGGRFFSTT